MALLGGCSSQDEPVLSQGAAQVDVDGSTPATIEAQAPLVQPGRFSPATCSVVALALLLYGSASFGKSGGGVAPPLRGLSEMLDGWAPSKISAESNSERCWKVGAEKGAYQNGMPLVIWDCKDADTFIIARSGYGPIRPSKAPDYCLHKAKKGEKIHFWLCSEASPDSVRFYLPPHKGYLRPVAEAGECVDVVGGINKNGNKMQVWECNPQKKNEFFVINWPFDCKWTPWTEWSVCTSGCKTWRSRRENPAKETTDPLALWSTRRSCSGVEEEVSGCRRGRCRAVGALQPPLVANNSENQSVLSPVVGSEQQPAFSPVTTESPHEQPVGNGAVGAADDEFADQTPSQNTPGSAFKQQAFGQLRVQSDKSDEPPAPVGQAAGTSTSSPPFVDSDYAERYAREEAAKERRRRQEAAIMNSEEVFAGGFAQAR